MNNRVRQVVATLALGLLFLVSVAGLALLGWEKRISCVITTTVLSVIVAQRISPIPPAIIALTMILVSVVFPVVAMYVGANYGEYEAPFWEIFNMVNWRKVFLPTVSAVATALCLRLFGRWRRPSNPSLVDSHECFGEETT